MSDLKERMVKMQKAAATRAAAGKGEPKTRVEQIIEESRTEQVHQNPSSSPGSSQSSQQREALKGKKRARDGGSAEEECELNVVGVGETYWIPPCFGSRELFSADNSLGVQKAEAEAITNAGGDARRKMLNQDAAAVMRVLETAMALNNQEVCSRAELVKAKVALEKADAKIIKLETDFDDYKDRYQIQIGLQTDLMEAQEGLAAAVKEKEKADEEKKTLEAEVDMLRKDAAPTEDETEEERALVSRGDLIARIRQLSQDCLEAGVSSFDDAIAQLRVKNPGVELVTEGTGYLHSIVDGEVVPPRFDDDMDM